MSQDPDLTLSRRAVASRPPCLNPEWCDGKNHQYSERELCNACFRYERAKRRAYLKEIAEMYKKRKEKGL
jgi:hypothetical protein